VHRLDHIAWFQKAIEARDLKKAMSVAHLIHEAEGEELGLRDSLDLLLLLFWEEDHRAQKAGDRWVEALTRKEASDAELLVAQAAIEGLKDRDSWIRCEAVLRILCSGSRRW
jgi:hypothetical protein